jgi:arylamine N-acetyltransferase
LGEAKPVKPLLENMTDAGIAQYFKRLQLEDCNTDLNGLMMLQSLHTMNIPFENLDIVVGRSIDLDYDHLFEKLVLKQRGGYCFELNLLFAELLTSLGFSVKPVLGRVWLSNPKGLPPRNHLAYLVELDGNTFITDVGFGGLVTRFPLNINDSTALDDKVGMVKVIPFADRQFMIQRQSENGWMNLYSFENIEIGKEDIEIANHYMSTHPNSHLYFHKCVGRNTIDGQIGLFNNKMTTRKGTKIVSKKRVDFGADWLETIKGEFSLHLDFSEKELEVLFEK